MKTFVKTQKTLIKGYDISYLDGYKGGSWVLSDILRSDNPYEDNHNVLTSAKESQNESYGCMGKRVNWSDRGWSVKCEDEYGYDSTTTTEAITDAATATTEFTMSTTTKSDDYFNGVHNGCCKTWSVSHGEFLVYCTHKKIYAYQHDSWMYECIDGYTDFGYMGKGFVRICVITDNH